MEKDKFLELLGRIESVDAPPFLYTRIKAKLDALSADRPARSWVFAGATALLFVLALNTFMFVAQGSGARDSDQSVSQLVNGMELNASNQLYNE